MNSFYETIFSKYGQPFIHTLARAEEETGEQPRAPERQNSAPPPRQTRIEQPSAPFGQTLSEWDIYSYPQNLRDALQLIESAINREAEDKFTYDFLLKNAPPEDLEILNQNHNDELTHFRILRRIYSELTGHEAPAASPLSQAVKKRSSYCEALKIGLKEINQQLKEYVRILYALQNRKHINMMLDIIIDEIRHIGTINYMYAKSCGK